MGNYYSLPADSLTFKPPKGAVFEEVPLTLEVDEIDPPPAAIVDRAKIYPEFKENGRIFRNPVLYAQFCLLLKICYEVHE
ncbi:hypothetical protein N7468_007615 [Penicillium chermesinum]|uniref:Uncharacterized protein n=1 Tax=Penicillium chermesinum TaxID=63820 RepID=A0A9W9NUN0_9EURO|nr:uncharacterized protein N7468_007615 [Penicillium chermesinum]KAJ5226390.1 hypothetical protein N7468_007615 [Penicillium chermesinum]